MATYDADTNTVSVVGHPGGLATYIDDVENRRFVQNRVQEVVTVAKNLYNTVGEKVPVVKKSFDTLDNTTGWIARPIVSGVSRLSQPVIERVDAGLGAAFTTIKRRRDSRAEAGNGASEGAEPQGRPIVDDAWFKQVDDILRDRLQRSTVSFKTFYDASLETFSSLQDLTYADFAAGLRKRLNAWDERYVAPSKALFFRAVERYHELDVDNKGRVDIQDVFRGLQSTFAKNWETRFVSNAQTLYQQAATYYLNMADKNLPIVQLIEGFKVQFGGAWWSDKLAQPLGDFFERARKAAREDLSVSLEGKRQQIKEAGTKVWNKGAGAVTGVRGYFHSHWTMLLDSSGRLVDFFLPEVTIDEEDESSGKKKAAAGGEVNAVPKIASVGALTTKITGRLRNRAQGCLRSARRLSSTTGKDVLQVDVIATAEDKLDESRNRVESWRHKVVTPRVQELKLRVSVARGRGNALYRYALDVCWDRKPAHLPHDLFLLAAKTVGLREQDPQFAEFQKRLMLFLNSLFDVVIWTRVVHNPAIIQNPAHPEVSYAAVANGAHPVDGAPIESLNLSSTGGESQTAGTNEGGVVKERVAEIEAANKDSQPLTKSPQMNGHSSPKKKGKKPNKETTL